MMPIYWYLPFIYVLNTYFEEFYVVCFKFHLKYRKLYLNFLMLGIYNDRQKIKILENEKQVYF